MIKSDSHDWRCRAVGGGDGGWARAAKPNAMRKCIQWCRKCALAVMGWRWARLAKLLPVAAALRSDFIQCYFGGVIAICERVSVIVINGILLKPAVVRMGGTNKTCNAYRFISIDMCVLLCRYCVCCVVYITHIIMIFFRFFFSELLQSHRPVRRLGCRSTRPPSWRLFRSRPASSSASCRSDKCRKTQRNAAVFPRLA